MNGCRLVKWLIALSTGATIYSGSAATAQDVIGSAVVGGKKIEILSDQTWRYQSRTEISKCVPVHSDVSFCGSILNWRPQAKSGYFSAIFSHSARIYGGLIIEDIGTNDGINHEYMRGTVLETAADAVGVAVEYIPVLDVFHQEVDGREAETIVYGARVDGVGFVYANTISIAENLTVQALVWGVGTEFTDKHRMWNEDFLENLRIETEAPIR
ncbi:MAG: hypothetical protein GY717_18775 [Rhodobacteraceae bacterium]|nr:hypothetical protein [Paracoccaceae bacterium]